MDCEKISNEQKKQLKAHCGSMMKTLHITFCSISFFQTLIFVIAIEVLMNRQYPEKTYKELTMENGTIF